MAGLWRFVCFLVAFGAQPALAGAFLEREGQGKIILSTTFEQSDRLFGSDGRVVPVLDYRKFELSAYGEYGLYDGLTTLVRLAGSRNTFAGPVQNDMETRGSVEAGARARLWADDWRVLSAQATILSASQPDGPGAWSLRRTTDIDMRLQFGASGDIGGTAMFGDLSAGLRKRFGAPDEARIDATFGLRPVADLMVLLQSFNKIAAASASVPMLRAHKVQASIVYELAADWSVQGGVFSTVAGRNIRNDRGFVTALWRKF